MSRELTLLGDHHSDEEVAERYQRFVEHYDPDIVFMEGSEVQDGERIEGELHKYMEVEKLCRALDIDIDEYFTETEQEYLDQLPVYAVNEERLEDIRGDYEEKDDPSKDRKRFEFVLDSAYLKRSSHMSSTGGHRLIDSAARMDADIYGLEVPPTHSDSVRREMYKYGAKALDDLPDDWKDVRKIQHRKVPVLRGEENIDDGTIASRVLGRLEMREEYNPIREEKMAENIVNQMKENNHRYAAAYMGKNHLEGVQDNLPDNWNINQVKLIGKPEEWEMKFFYD